MQWQTEDGHMFSVLPHPGEGEALSLPLDLGCWQCAPWPVECHSAGHGPGPWEIWQNSKISYIPRSLLVYLAHPSSSFLSHWREAFLLIFSLSFHLFNENRHNCTFIYTFMFIYILPPNITYHIWYTSHCLFHFAM